MFKRLKEKITEEVSKSPLRLQTVQSQIGQYSPFNGAAKKPSDSQGSSESDAPTQNDSQNLIDLQENSSSIMDVSESQQFSIADEDGASSATTSPVPHMQKFENVDLTAINSAHPGPVGRPRTSSVSSTGSQPSFFPVYSPMQSSYSIQSDLESTSEMEDAGVNLDIISKEQLYQAFQKAKAKYARYKNRYGDAVNAYREQVNEKEKIKSILTESQDKALRRISELREQSQLEQKAKAHLEDNFRVTLEEKDELLRVLQTQVRLLKNGEDTTEKQDEDDSQNHLIDISSDSIKGDNEDATDENTQLKLKTYEETIVKLKSLLKNCKDTIIKHRENNVRLAAEKDQLAEQLNEANAQLKHFMEEKSEKDRDLLNELMQASQTIENLKTKEVDDALSMAETKRLMHEEMEGKEKKLQDLKVELQQLQVDKDELQKTVAEKCNEISEIELKCKNEVQLAKQQLEDAEKMLEDEKQNLLQELSRGKAAAIQLMQQEADKRLAEMEGEKSAALQTLEMEWQAKMQEKVKEEIENLVKQDALESTITMSDHFTNQIATLKKEVQEKETQLKHLIEEKTLFQEQIQEQCSKQAVMENEIANMALVNNLLQGELDQVRMSGANPLYAFKDAITGQLSELRNWIAKVKSDVGEHMNESAEWFSEMNSEVLKLSRAHNCELQPLIGTIESLKLENENYSRENFRVKDDFDAAQLKIARLEEELSNSNAGSENGAAEIARMQEDLDVARQKVEYLEDQLNNSNTALEQLQAQLKLRETELKFVQEKFTVVTEKEQQWEAEREVALQELACLQLLRDDLNVLGASYAKAGGEIVALRVELEDKDAEIANLVARNDQLDGSSELAESLKADVLDRDSKISDLETSLRIEVEKNEALLKTRTESSALQGRPDAEAPGSQLLEANKELVLELDNTKNFIETLRGEVDFLKKQSNTNKLEHEGTVGEIEAQRNELERLKEEKNDLSSRLAEQDAVVSQLEKERILELDEKEERLRLLNDAKHELAEQHLVIGQLEEQKSKLSGSLAEINALITQLKEEQNDQNTKLSEKEDLLQKLELEKNDLSLKLEEKVAALQMLEECKIDTEAKLSETIARANRFENELAESRNGKDDSEKLRSDLERCQEALFVKTELAEELVAKVNSLELTMNENAGRTDLLEGEANRLREHVSSLEAQILAVSEVKENLEKTISELEQTNTSQKEKVHEIEEKLGLAESELLATERRHSEAMESLEKSYKDKMNELLQKCKNKLSTLKQAHAEQLAKLENEASASALLRNMVEDLEAKVRNAEADYAALMFQNTSSLESAKREFSVLSEHFGLTKAENEKLKICLEEAVGSVNSADIENRSFVQEITSLKIKISALQEELGTVVQERDKMTHDEMQKASTECQRLLAALDKALAQKDSLENELGEQISQLQAATVLKEAEIAELRTRVREQAATIEALQVEKSDLEHKMLNEREEFKTTMLQSLQQVNEENQSKLADLRKRAENKLAQIKKQLVYDADKTKEELQAKIANLEEQKRLDDETWSEKLAKERDNVKLEYEEKIDHLEKSLLELQTTVENEKEALVAELSLKNTQIDESLLNAQENHAEMSQRISSLQSELEHAEASLKTGESELAELRRQLAEKEELAKLMEAQLQTEGESSEYEQLLKCKVEEHAIKIKQLVKEFSVMIAQKEEEGQQALAKAIETSMNDDNRLRREHAVHLHEIQNEFVEKELSFEMALEEKESIIQAKSADLERCNKDYEEKMDVMKTEHQRQMQELEKKWKAMLRKELKQQAAMHEEDVNGLTQEWQLERKFAPGIDYNSVAKIDVMQEELQQQTQLASSAIESGGQSSELLRRQIMTMQTQMEMLKDRHKAEVNELHQILQASNCPVPLGKSTGQGIFADRPALQSLEIEYLKNILFEYMMGRETLTLAKVIATVVQFSDEQLNKILEKEESRGGGVSGQLGQIWK